LNWKNADAKHGYGEGLLQQELTRGYTPRPKFAFANADRFRK
jgi:hypothetical protein